MKNYELKYIDPEDIEDFLLKVEASLGVRFVSGEFAHITNLGQLCDHIVHKIHLHQTDDCTSQQAFYQLRNAIASVIPVNQHRVAPNTLLNDLFPKPIRRSQIKKVEQQLGFEIGVLRAPNWQIRAMLIMLLASVACLFFNGLLGLSAFGLSIAGFWIANKTGVELDLQTVGQVAKKITQENYLKSRRNPNSYNKKEVENMLLDWFQQNFQ